MALTSEGDVDAQGPKGGLRATQPGSERAGILRPARAAPRNTVPAAIGTDPKNKAGAAFLKAFVEEAKKSGMVAKFIEQHKVVGLSVAPPA